MLDAHAAVMAARDSLDNPPEVAEANVSDDFIITTTSDNFGCSIAAANAPTNDPTWLMLLLGMLVRFLQRRHKDNALF